VLYQEHADKGYTVTKTHNICRKDGEKFTTIWTYFTQRGRFWLYELLKGKGILPTAERGDFSEQEQLF
jgi:anti-repressor protein